MKSLLHRTFLTAITGSILVGVTLLNGGMTRGLFAQSEPSPPARPASQRTSFSFLHTYESTGRYWRGIEQAGLVRPGCGVRLINSPWGSDERRFNTTARLDGPLHAILEDRKCPFIVDRVVGGSIYNPYQYDSALVEHYASMLGPKFLGGQIHETISNVHNDWRRLVNANPKYATEPVNPDDIRNLFTGGDAEHLTEYGTLDDYAGRVHYRDQESLWKEIHWALTRQAARVNSHFSYCEGSVCGDFVWHIFYKFGAAYGLAEVGVWASNDSQLTIASLRGAARAAGKPWGVFFAPWGPNGCTSFIPIEDVSWQCGEQFLENTGWPAGPEYGFSSALQRRIFFHSYLSGAHTLHEEWGAECNLVDWDAGTLSSYGRATKEFLDFQDAHPDVGEPYTPVALVLDAAVPPPKPTAWESLRKKLFQFSEVDRANEALKTPGNAEVRCYSPCSLAELFDIVPSDAPAEVWANYQEIIPVGTAPLPPGANPCPPEAVYDRLAAAVKRLAPMAISTHLPMQINHRASDGAWIVALYNPWGAWRGDINGVGSVFDERCAISDVVRPTFKIKSARTLYAWPAASRASLSDNAIALTIGPGGVLILEIVEAN